MLSDNMKSSYSYIFLTILSIPAPLKINTHSHDFKFASLSHWFQAHLFVGHHSNKRGIGTFSKTGFRENPDGQKRKDGSGEPIGTVCRAGLSEEELGSFWAEANIYASLLQECIRKDSLEYGKKVHAHTIKAGIESDIFVANNLVNMYAKCRRLIDARQVFDKMPERDVVSWNAIIAGYARHGYSDTALKLFELMQRAGMELNKFTFASVTMACTGLATLGEGKRVHALVIKSGFDSDVFTGSNLADMYAKCKDLELARKVFDKMPVRDAVSWNTMIARYVHVGNSLEALRVLCQMQRAGMTPDEFSFASSLGACAGLTALGQGKQFHAYIIKSGYESDVFMGNALLDMYAKCASIEDARRVFDQMPKQDVVSWNSMIVGYAQNEQEGDALALFCQMQQAGIKPDPFTFSSVLSVCSTLADLEQGKRVHNLIINSDLHSNVFVGSALVDMYAKCGSTDDARKVFDVMPKRDAFSWSAMIAGYAQHGLGQEALKLFIQMQHTAMKPDVFNLASSLRACASLAGVEQGKQIHAHIIKCGCDSDIVVGCAIVDMYAKCGSMEDGHKVFDEMPEQNDVSWTALIGGYAQNGHGDKSLKLYCQMRLAGRKPEESTFASILRASACLAALEHGKQIHGQIIKFKFDSDVFVGTSLVDMYAKCGSIEDARDFFTQMSYRNVVSWNSMIAGYAQNGNDGDALQLFEQMQRAGMKPNHITFVGVLSACSHVGLIDEGRHYFDSMTRDHGIISRMEHYACMVDILGRAGHLDEAKNFINKMPFEPGSMVWRTLLGACRVHKNIELGNHAAKRVLKLEPHDAATYVLLSNTYAGAGRWDDVAEVRKVMRDKGVKKDPGCSWIEVKNRMHAFVVGDKSHPQTEEIYAKLEGLTQSIKEMGYVPDRNFVLLDVEDEEKEHFLFHHSEKLAISFGLMSMPPRMPIRVVKNLRVCGDCHTAIKFICKFVQQEIIVRDANRFHHFKNGLCSCGDYW